MQRRIAATVLAVSGWMLACVAVAGIASLWYAVKLSLAPIPYRTPEAWVVARAFVYGLPFALVPIAAYLRLARRAGNDDAPDAVRT